MVILRKRDGLWKHKKSLYTFAKFYHLFAGLIDQDMEIRDHYKTFHPLLSYMPEPNTFICGLSVIVSKEIKFGAGQAEFFGLANSMARYAAKELGIEFCQKKDKNEREPKGSKVEFTELIADLRVTAQTCRSENRGLLFVSEFKDFAIQTDLVRIASGLFRDNLLPQSHFDLTGIVDHYFQEKKHKGSIAPLTEKPTRVTADFYENMIKKLCFQYFKKLIYEVRDQSTFSHSSDLIDVAIGVTEGKIKLKSGNEINDTLSTKVVFPQSCMVQGLEEDIYLGLTPVSNQHSARLNTNFTDFTTMLFSIKATEYKDSVSSKKATILTKEQQQIYFNEILQSLLNSCDQNKLNLFLLENIRIGIDEVIHRTHIFFEKDKKGVLLDYYITSEIITQILKRKKLNKEIDGIIRWISTKFGRDEKDRAKPRYTSVLSKAIRSELIEGTRILLNEIFPINIFDYMLSLNSMVLDRLARKQKKNAQIRAQSQGLDTPKPRSPEQTVRNSQPTAAIPPPTIHSHLTRSKKRRLLNATNATNATSTKRKKMLSLQQSLPNVTSSILSSSILDVDIASFIVSFNPTVKLEGEFIKYTLGQIRQKQISFDIGLGLLIKAISSALPDGILEDESVVIETKLIHDSSTIFY